MRRVLVALLRLICGDDAFCCLCCVSDAVLTQREAALQGRFASVFTHASPRRKSVPRVLQVRARILREGAHSWSGGGRAARLGITHINFVRRAYRSYQCIVCDKIDHGGVDCTTLRGY